MSLKVTSHIARDLLQSAALFRHPQQVVWEYVSNGLQYVDYGVAPIVRVTVSREGIMIEDNGRGMTRADLTRFFTMHAENLDRRQGQPGRGMFGTGKSAAFAIAESLKLSTVRGGLRNVVELRRSDLEAASDGAPVPVRDIEADAPTDEPNGTCVWIGQLKRGVRPKVEEIRGELERHLKHWRGVRVDLNGDEIEPSRPTFDRELSIPCPEEAGWLAGVTLRLFVARAPLQPADVGVAILANDVLHETTLAGAEGKEFSNYIFGEIDVPALAMPIDGIDAYDMSRSGRLNPQNPAVAATLAFVGRHVEYCRQELVRAARERRKLEEERRFQRQADEIAQLINRDYAEFAQRLKPTQARESGSVDARDAPVQAPNGEEAFLAGGEDLARRMAEIEPIPVSDETDPSPPKPEPGPNPDAATPAVERAEDELADATGRDVQSEPKPARRAGGFSVRYAQSGDDNHRCTYDAAARTLIINLDHPQVSAAKGTRDLEHPNFRRLSYEIAFTEYAVALASELVKAHHFIDMGEPLTAVRERIDSLCRSAAAVFADDS